MSPEMLKQVEQLLTEQYSQTKILLLLLAAFLAIVTGFVGAYLKKKGEAYATKEGFKEHICQLRDTTRTVETEKEPFAKGLATFSLGLSKGLEDHKKTLLEQLEVIKRQHQESLQYRAAIIGPQLEAYRALWAVLYVVRPTRIEPISERERSDLLSALTSWYYSEGNGICLSFEAGKAWRSARNTLTDGLPDSAVKNAFSSLRTRLKLDLEVYGPEEADAPLGK